MKIVSGGAVGIIEDQLASCIDKVVNIAVRAQAWLLQSPR